MNILRKKIVRQFSDYAEKETLTKIVVAYNMKRFKARAYLSGVIDPTAFSRSTKEVSLLRLRLMENERI